MKAGTLQKIEAEILAGDYGRARDRLHGLLVTYPDDLSLRRKLGDVYWHLQFPAMAGRFWYLEADKTPEMQTACQAFERSCGDDPLQMLLALKFRGNIESIQDTLAGRTLLVLQERAKTERGCAFELGKSGREKYGRSPLSHSTSKWGWIACLTLALVALALLVIGLVAVFRWIF